MSIPILTCSRLEQHDHHMSRSCVYGLRRPVMQFSTCILSFCWWGARSSSVPKVQAMPCIISVHERIPSHTVITLARAFQRGLASFVPRIPSCTSPAVWERNARMRAVITMINIMSVWLNLEGTIPQLSKRWAMCRKDLPIAIHVSSLAPFMRIGHSLRGLQLCPVSGVTS